jgi:hypothetical protein
VSAELVVDTDVFSYVHECDTGRRVMPTRTQPTKLNYAARAPLHRRRWIRVVALVVVASALLYAPTRWWPPIVYAPWLLKASANAEGYVVLRWPDAVGEEYYRIERRDGAGQEWRELFNYERDSSETLDLNSVPGAEHTYRLTAVNRNGTARYREVKILAPLVPPRAFWASPYDGGDVSLGWRNAIACEYMLLSRSTDGLNFDWKVRLPQNADGYDDLTAAAPATYYYRLQPYDAAQRPIGPYASVVVTVNSETPEREQNEAE